MSNPTQSAIIWPDEFLPGTTDIFLSNEVIVSGITASQIWAKLVDISQWSTYYRNVSQITPPSTGVILQKGSAFKFSTFGFPILECPVEECVAPSEGLPGRIAWSARLDGGPGMDVAVYHAWLVEDLEGGRVRVLTQETQKGKPVAAAAGRKPNRPLLGHQDWLDGLVKAAKGEKVDLHDTNLSAVGLESYEAP